MRRIQHPAMAIAVKEELEEKVMLTFFNKKCEPITAYWWRRLMQRGPNYWTVMRTYMIGGIVTTNWIGVASESDQKPLIFATTVRVEGLPEVTSFTPTENAAIKAHNVCVYQARMDSQKVKVAR